MTSEVALIIGGGPGISASCARLFRQEGMTVAVAARRPDKDVLKKLAADHQVHLHACDAADPESVATLFAEVSERHGAPRLVVHNIDGRVEGIFRKSITEADPQLALQTLQNGAYSAFLVGQNAAAQMLTNAPDDSGKRGTILFTNASAAHKGYPLSGAFAMTCQAKKGLAESMARELMPEGIHVAQIPIDAAIGWTQEDGSRAHRLAGTSQDDNMADPDRIADAYLFLHRQHRSTMAFDLTLRPWLENW